MADLREALSKGLANPGSLQQQSDIRKFFYEDHSQAEANEPNMLTFLTMRDLFGKNSDAGKAAMKTAEEETKYLATAMQILQSDPEGKPMVKRLQDKFGKDLKGSNDLAKLLREEKIKTEYEQDIRDLLSETAIEGRATTRVFTR
jgi:hypothetical protein